MTSAEFSMLYRERCEFTLCETSLMNLSVDEQLNQFNSVCVEILDSVAPLKVKRGKTKYQPWVNESLRNLRQLTRQAERQ